MEFSSLCLLKNHVCLSSVQFKKHLLSSMMFPSTVLRYHVFKISLRAAPKELKVGCFFLGVTYFIIFFKFIFISWTYFNHKLTLFLVQL